MSPSQGKVIAEFMHKNNCLFSDVWLAFSPHSPIPQQSRGGDKPMYCAPSTGFVAMANPSHGRFAMQISLEHTGRN